MTFLPFLEVSLLIIMTPGPDTALIIRNTLFGGRQGGVFTALGVATGQTIWALATSLGIVALLVASEPLFLAVKIAGAGYLIYLGMQALREALRPATAARGLAFAARGDRRLRSLTAFRQGLVSDLGNPKIAVFFASLLPQFVPVGDTSFWHLLLLGIVFALIALAWLTLYATAMAIFEEFLRRSAVRRVIAGVTGTVLVGLGLRIAAEQR